MESTQTIRDLNKRKSKNRKKESIDFNKKKGVIKNGGWKIFFSNHRQNHN